MAALQNLHVDWAVRQAIFQLILDEPVVSTEKVAGPTLHMPDILGSVSHLHIESNHQH